MGSWYGLGVVFRGPPCHCFHSDFGLRPYCLRVRALLSAKDHDKQLQEVLHVELGDLPSLTSHSSLLALQFCLALCTWAFESWLSNTTPRFRVSFILATRAYST